MHYDYSSREFEEQFTYSGSDLGAVWTPEHTFFRVWAPTANAVHLNLYHSGTPWNQDLIRSLPMKPAKNGTWTADIDGNLNGIYYTYTVTIGKKATETNDPYARAVGVNGKRAMVIDLRSTDPENWHSDSNPNAGLTVTDHVLYELHVRDLSADASSGICHKGKYLGLTEANTVNRRRHSTGLEHIKSLGITHLHLLPVFDFGSLNEANPEDRHYNWGYDPMNFNVPEGTYSTDPFDGYTRIREMKQMISVLHQNGISVVMDVVYNHVFHTFEFSMNQLVPGYFSRQNPQGHLSNGSGCGNDTASERSMVRKYIVDSVNYWADEYHIDGFRFDLAGLIDVQTIHEIMETVKEKHPHTIFYGEGWSMDSYVTKENTPMANQYNAHMLDGFAFFNDTMRDTMRGPVFDSRGIGFSSGASVSKEHLMQCFCGRTSWTSNPAQIINYISCHDNHTLYDRIAEALPDADHGEIARRCRMTAAFSLLSSGIPFFQAGEEMLRTKKNRSGKFISNSYRSPDSINSIKWSRLSDRQTKDTLEYYKGLLSLRKKYSLFRMADQQQICHRVNMLPGDIPAFLIHGNQERMLCIFHAGTAPATLMLPLGSWEILVNDKTAGTQPLGSAAESLTIPPLSAFVLIQKRLR